MKNFVKTLMSKDRVLVIRYLRSILKLTALKTRKFFFHAMVITISCIVLISAIIGVGVVLLVRDSMQWLKKLII